jgi:hypothetical protein
MQTLRGGEEMTIIEFLKILETANGDQALELIHSFQCGELNLLI